MIKFNVNLKILTKENKLKYIIILCILVLLLSFASVSFAANDELNLYSPVYLLMEAKTGKVIYQKDADKKMYPASITKIMTAILAIENCNLSDKATASYNAIYTVPVSYTNANIKVGEELTINQLLNVLLVASANDAANILAEHVAGSVDSFVTMMNTKASEIGCQNTHFVNASGVHDENHYSTAYDLALIGRYAMQNEVFRKYVGTESYTLPATNKFSTNDRFFKNTNELLLKDTSDKVDNYYYEYTTGIKTGYTNAAKNCIVASAKKNGIEYIVVILGADTTDNGLSARFLDCKTLFNYAFDNYSIKTLYEEGSVLKSIKVPKGSLSTRKLDLIVKDEVSAVIKNSTDISSLNPTIEITPDLQAPVVKNSVVGKLTFNIDGNEYTSNLIASKDVAEAKISDSTLILIALFVILLILYKLLSSGNKKKKKKTKKSNKASRNYLYW